MTKHSRLIAWSIIGLYLGQILVSIGLGHLILEGGVGAPGALAVALLMLFVATRMRGLNNIIHECSHASFTVDRLDNVRMGKICASLLFNSFNVYRDEHLSHHKYIGDYEHDLDLQGIKNLGLHDKLTTQVLIRHLTTPLRLRHLPYYLSLNLSRTDGRVFQIVQYALIGAVSMLTALAPWTGLLMVVVPFVFIFSALNYWADCMDHAGLVPTEEDLEASRNLLAPKVLRWLFFPRNDCFHLVHHLFPQVPARHLESTHAALMEDRIYTSHENAVRGFADMKPAKKPEMAVVTPAE